MTCYTGWGGPEQNQNTLDKRKNFRNHRDNSTKHKMISAEELLKPISDENPCGEDLYYDPSFQELESLMKGKAETQFSPAEDPDWKALRERCLGLLKRSKDLRLVTALCVAVTKTEGLLAVREGMKVLRTLLEQHWEKVYPKLDPDDNNDPLYRVNIIAALSTAKGTMGDPMRFLERLAEAPLTDSPQMGRFSRADIARSQAPAAGAEAKPGASAAQIEAAFRDTKPERLQEINTALSETLSFVKEIDSYLTKTVGTDNAPDLGLLETEIKEIRKCLVPYLPAGAVPASETVEGAAGPVAGESAPQPISGEIQSRKDVVRMLEKVCQYYTRAEPASPVPNLLRRAQRLAEMDFMQIINEMCPDGVSQVRAITGEKPEA